MTRTGTTLIAGLSIGTVALVLACTEDSSQNTSSSSGGTTTSSGGGSSSGATSGTSSSGQTSTGTDVNRCRTTTQTGTCTEADFKPYSDCFTEKCDSAYKECYGADYKSGNFSGPCGEYITCAQKCDCKDTACFQNCTQSGECQTCSQKFATCGQSCQLPACATGGPGGSPTACADLLTCCNKLSEPEKTQCTQAHGFSQGQSSACQSLLDSYKSKCP